MGGKPRPHRMRGLPTPAETRKLRGDVLVNIPLTREQYACLLELMETGLYGESMSDVLQTVIGSGIRYHWRLFLARRRNQRKDPQP